MSSDSIAIRQASPADSEALLAIYAPFVISTSVSFDTRVPSADEFAALISKATTGWQWLVAEREGRCVGYAYGSQHRARSAYRWSVEVSVYIDPAVHRQGIGRALYARLIDDLTEKGFCNAFAGIALPNDSSIALHRRLGFEPVGTFRNVGWKFGRWHDVAWYQRSLRPTPPPER